MLSKASSHKVTCSALRRSSFASSGRTAKLYRGAQRQRPLCTTTSGEGEGDWNRARLGTLFGQEKAYRIIAILDRERARLQTRAESSRATPRRQPARRPCRTSRKSRPWHFPLGTQCSISVLSRCGGQDYRCRKVRISAYIKLGAGASACVHRSGHGSREMCNSSKSRYAGGISHLTSIQTGTHALAGVMTRLIAPAQFKACVDNRFGRRTDRLAA